VSEFQGIRSAKTEIRFWRTDRNRPSRGYPGWSHPQFRVSLCIFAGGVDATSHSISAGLCDHAWDGGDHPRGKRDLLMKQCGEQRQSAKSAGTTKGATRPQFLAQCRAQLGSGAATAAPPAPSTQPQTGSLFPWQTPAAPTPAPMASTAAGNQSDMKQCGAQWQAAKAAGTTSGATWPQFLKSCRAQLASTTSAPPQGGFMPAPAPAPAPAPSPAPTQSGSLFPWQRPATPPAGSVASTGDGSASAQEAQYHCSGSTVVWVNEHSLIYHFPGTRDYGHTKSGAYMCEAEARTSGNRAAMNERHP
jgi:hypothetical protein